ncbi:MAG TPA: universal stress protein [Pseudonocardia sp.]|uniref:universal stress protein n=1 Tax=Pseudonocardia sp. TaxID=60912 RepID=UPI002B4AC600|nr:universal stress protein [Pseudonocardia sp.]HLU54831.1 universal stress protein [Pseudonocardia sp.]
MNATTTAPGAGTRPGPGASPGGTLVVVGDEVPGWALRRSAEAARRVERRAAPAHPADPASCRRVEELAEIGVRAARRGDPVLVLPGPHRGRARPPRVVAAVRSFPDDDGVLAEAAACAGHMGAELVVAHGLPASFGEHSVGIDAAAGTAGDLLAAAVRAATRRAPGVRVRGWLARMQPHELVGERLDADLLVLGGPRRGGPLGLVARSALFHAPCAVLLTPRAPAPVGAGGGIR